jgi:hypothetical protein
MAYNHSRPRAAEEEEMRGPLLLVRPLLCCVLCALWCCHCHPPLSLARPPAQNLSMQCGSGGAPAAVSVLIAAAGGMVKGAHDWT